MIWQDISGGWVLLPQEQKGIVHFLGGAFVATAPNITYRCVLEELGKQGYVVIATPFVNTLDHSAIARNVLNRFESILYRLQETNSLSNRYLPVYGVGHSLGCKLHLLIGSLYKVERSGNILISYNNYPASRAIPFLESFSGNPSLNLNVEFTPSPEETNDLIAGSYAIRRNLLIQFSNDTIDQCSILSPVLESRFPNMVTVQKLPGNHLTPLSQDINWQVGKEFTPLDAIGQWVKQTFSRELVGLNSEISRWLNPVW
ncbi:MAG: DUF1350 family protein [Chroococcales cyanobacterium]